MTMPSDGLPHTAPISLTDLLDALNARFVVVRDGEVICLQPDSAEAQALAEQVRAALAAGTITTLPASGPRDG
ncbi:MAG: hypothetical protein H0X24_09865 [Ktedonobacterales bacterium]|nr:hypothetical protein [Ktedonobacterales bacterium]